MSFYLKSVMSLWKTFLKDYHYLTDSEKNLLTFLLIASIWILLLACLKSNQLMKTFISLEITWILILISLGMWTNKTPGSLIFLFGGLSMIISLESALKTILLINLFSKINSSSTSSSALMSW